MHALTLLSNTASNGTTPSAKFPSSYRKIWGNDKYSTDLERVTALLKDYAKEHAPLEATPY